MYKRQAKAEKSKLLSYAYSLEKKSEHPLAKAICDYAQDAEAVSYTHLLWQTHLESSLCSVWECGQVLLKN